jgi:hypothetical protein
MLSIILGINSKESDFCSGSTAGAAPGNSDALITFLLISRT